jgi:hypothetical protein
LVNYILAEHDKQQAKILPVKLIDGDDIMDTFDLTPGPLVGKLLAMVNEAHASGELDTREQALAFVQRELSTVKKQHTKVAPKPGNCGMEAVPNAKVD